MSRPASSNSRHPFVLTYLYGGLGNQLFQYAAGRSLASRLGAKLILDAGSYRQPGQRRRYCLEPFAVAAEMVESGRPPYPSLDRDHDSPIADFRSWVGDLASGILGAMGSPSHGGRSALPIFRERTAAYDSRFATLRAPVALVGYWQSSRYFAPIGATIRDHCRSTGTTDGENTRWLKAIEQSDSVCIHVRRGDFLHAAERHRPPAMAYYERAMGQVRKRIANPRFFVFSDDWPWVRRHFTAGDLVLVDCNSPEAAAAELMLMAACRHHIIANSTLSWWGAWLAARPGQIVIAPDPWFHRGRPTPDLLPQEWIKISRD
jgi:hypothetical protein